MAAQLYNTKKKGINQPEAVAMTTAFDQLSIGVKKKNFLIKKEERAQQKLYISSKHSIGTNK